MHQSAAFDPTIYAGNRTFGRASRRPPGVNIAMSRNQRPRAFSRSLSETIEESIAILRQDASEYAFIGLVGAFAACMAVLVPGIIGGPIAVALIAPLLVIIAALTLATSAAALGVGANQLQPDASRAFANAGLRIVPILRPWLPLAIALGAASYAADAFASRLGPVPPEAIMLGLALVSAAYALPRSLCSTALFEHDLPARQALSASAALVRRATRTVATAWIIVLSPAIVIALLGGIAGIDPATGAVIAVLFVGAIPAGAALMSQLFIDAASSMEVAPPPPAGAPSGIAHRRA